MSVQCFWFQVIQQPSNKAQEAQKQGTSKKSKSNQPSKKGKPND